MDIMTKQPKGIDLVIIRRVKLGEASALVAIYNSLSESSKRTFRPLGSTTTLDVCEDIVQDNRPETDEKFDLVALHETRIVGWSFLWNLKSDEPVFGLAVSDDYQGKGLGGSLMDRVMKAACERELGKVCLTVVKDNEVAWRMYEKRGFVVYDEYVAEDGLAYFRMARNFQ